MNNTPPDQNVAAPVLKLISAWAAVGITSWAEAASFAAFCYTLILIGDWAWKKFNAPRRGRK